MSLAGKTRIEMEKYIMRKIALDDADVINKTMDSFDIPMESVMRCLEEALEGQIIEKTDERAAIVW